MLVGLEMAEENGIDFEIQENYSLFSIHFS